MSVSRNGIGIAVLMWFLATAATAQQSTPSPEEATGAPGDVVDEVPIPSSLRGRVLLTDPTKRNELTARPMRVTTDAGRRDTIAQVTLLDVRGGEVLSSTYTEADGSFVFANLEPMRRYLVRAERARFQNTEVEVMTSAAGVTDVALRMPARKTVGWYFKAGGELMWPLLAQSILCVYVALERAYVILVRQRGDSAALVTRVQGLVESGNVVGAVAVCAGERSPVAAVLMAGLQQWEHGKVAAEKAMENAAIDQVARLERGLAILSSSSGLAPVIGFLGTVVGMIMAFDAIAEHGRIDPSYVADGISTALITTAGGLLVAVFALPAYQFFNSRIAQHIRQMETAANLLLESDGPRQS